jgi:hypothetical protein
MKERERIVVTEITLLMLLVWLGFFVHRSPRFPGSFWGTMLGVSGATLMLVPAVYSFIKRSGLHSRIRGVISMKTLLAWHVYAGLTGPILAILHTGHKFDSPLGVALTSLMLVVALSGFVGRYLYLQASEDRATKQGVLDKLYAVYRQAAPASPIGYGTAQMAIEGSVITLAESIADVEYAIKTTDLFKRLFWIWLKIHIAIAGFLYLLLAMHIWSAVHFGLRWYWVGAEL